MGWKPIVNTNGLALDEPLLRDLKKAGVYGFTIHSENEVNFLQSAGPYHQESHHNFKAGLYLKPYNPPVVTYLFPFMTAQPNFLMFVSTFLIIGGNILTFVAVRTLRAHVTFHEFGEARSLHTAGIYKIIRNPITVGLGVIFTGFFLALPSAVMLFGWIVFLLNSAYRVSSDFEKNYNEPWIFLPKPKAMAS